MACCEDKEKIAAVKKQIEELVSSHGLCCVSCVTNGCHCGESTSRFEKEVAACPCS